MLGRVSSRAFLLLFRSLGSGRRYRRLFYRNQCTFFHAGSYSVQSLMLSMYGTISNVTFLRARILRKFVSLGCHCLDEHSIHTCYVYLEVCLTNRNAESTKNSLSIDTIACQSLECLPTCVSPVNLPISCIPNAVNPS